MKVIKVFIYKKEAKCFGSELSGFLLVVEDPVVLVLLPGGPPPLVRGEKLGEAAALLSAERVDEPERNLDDSEPSESPACVLGCRRVHGALGLRLVTQDCHIGSTWYVRGSYVSTK